MFNVSASYTESLTVSETVEVELEPGEGVSIDVIGIMKQIELTADRYYDVEFLDNTTEIFDEHIQHEIETVTGHRIVVNNI